jgi:hypothetical protein
MMLSPDMSFFENMVPPDPHIYIFNHIDIIDHRPIKICFEHMRYPLVNVNKKLWNDHHFFHVKTHYFDWAIFNSYIHQFLHHFLTTKNTKYLMKFIGSNYPLWYQCSCFHRVFFMLFMV